MQNDRHVFASQYTILSIRDREYPESLRLIPDPPPHLYVVGNVGALQEGIAIVGARKATPYGIGCARHFASLCAKRGIVVISGGALGCDSAAHEGALQEVGKTVVFLGGGCDQPYPKSNKKLFERVVNSGGALVSEHDWFTPPLPWMFRLRNRLIAGLAKATLIVEAGLPSGTFSTADEALAAGKEVLAIPGAITSHTSVGSNKLIYQGATPIVDDESFQDILRGLFEEGVQQTLFSSDYIQDWYTDKQEEGKESLWPKVEQDGLRVSSFSVSEGLISEKIREKKVDNSQMLSHTKEGLTNPLNNHDVFSQTEQHLIAALSASVFSLDELFTIAREIDDNYAMKDLLIFLEKARLEGKVSRHCDARYGPPELSG